MAINFIVFQNGKLRIGIPREEDIGRETYTDSLGKSYLAIYSGVAQDLEQYNLVHKYVKQTSTQEDFNPNELEELMFQES